MRSHDLARLLLAAMDGDVYISDADTGWILPARMGLHPWNAKVQAPKPEDVVIHGEYPEAITDENMG